MSVGPWQIVIVVLLIVLFFGRGRISDMMGDLAKGITSFKKGLREDEDAGPASAPQDPPRMVSHSSPPSEPVVDPVSEDRNAN